MTPTGQFVTVERLPGRLRLRREVDGVRGSVEIRGVVLEGQLELSSGEVLLWSSEDCPYEETLHITLVSPSAQVLESMELGRPMQPGLFQNLQPVGRQAAEFDFLPQQRHRLEVKDAPCGLLTHILRRRRLQLTSRDQATTDDEPT